MFEVRLRNLKNALIGLYFNSTIFDETVDYLVFYPEQCESMRHCLLNDDDSITFFIENASTLNINLIPKLSGLPMQGEISYKLMNEERRRFIRKTILMLVLGFLLAALLMAVLFKAINLYNF